MVNGQTPTSRPRQRGADFGDEGWTFGRMIGSTEWLTVAGSFWRSPVLHATQEAAVVERDAHAGNCSDPDSVVVARVRAVFHGGVSGSGMAFKVLERPSQGWQEWQDQFAWTSGACSPVEGARVLSAFTTLTPGLGELTDPPGFHLQELFSNPPFSMVWTSREHHAIVTYTEGDLSIWAAEDEAGYDRIRNHVRAFYLEMRRP